MDTPHRVSIMLVTVSPLFNFILLSVARIEIRPIVAYTMFASLKTMHNCE